MNKLKITNWNHFWIFPLPCRIYTPDCSSNLLFFNLTNLSMTFIGVRIISCISWATKVFYLYVYKLASFPEDKNTYPAYSLYIYLSILLSYNLFRSENYKLHQLSNQSVLSVCLQAGLASLKTHYCIEPNHSDVTSHIQVKINYI